MPVQISKFNLITLVVVGLQTIIFAVLYYKIHINNLAYFDQVNAHLKLLEATLAHNQALINHLNLQNIQNQQLHMQIASHKAWLSSGIYHGDNQFLQIITSKPVLIAGGIIVGLIGLYALFNNLHFSGTINKNLGRFSTDIHEKVADVNSNMGDHVKGLQTSLQTINNNLDTLNSKLGTLEKVGHVNKINMETKIQSACNDVIHQIISFFKGKPSFNGGNGGGGVMYDFPSVPNSLSGTIRVEQISTRVTNLQPTQDILTNAAAELGNIAADLAASSDLGLIAQLIA